MARSRVPETGGVVAAVVRTLGLGASVALLANLIYESINWRSRGKTYGLSITAALVAILVDGSEVAGLIDHTRTVPRAPRGLMACEDIVVICLAAPSAIIILLSDYRMGGPMEERRPWRDADALSLFLTIGICCFRVCLSVWACVECCRGRKWRQRPRRPTIVQEEPIVTNVSRDTEPK